MAIELTPAQLANLVAALEKMTAAAEKFTAVVERASVAVIEATDTMNRIDNDNNMRRRNSY